MAKRDNFPFWNRGTGRGLKAHTQIPTGTGGYYNRVVSVPDQIQRRVQITEGAAL